MKNIIPAIIVIICIVAGGIGGNFLRTSGGGASAGAEKHAGEKAKSSHGEEAKGGHGASEPAKDSHAKDSHAKDSGEKDSHGGGGSSGVDYFKFTREFVVPVMREARVDSLVILNINLEVDSSITPKLFSMEPKIRDNIMTTLIGLSNDGQTLEAISNIDNYESIRASVLMNLQKIIPTGIENVLIVDMAKQEL
jgi:flagellar basal body-associated protein FliL